MSDFITVAVISDLHGETEFTKVQNCEVRDDRVLIIASANATRILAPHRWDEVIITEADDARTKALLEEVERLMETAYERGYAQAAFDYTGDRGDGSVPVKEPK